MSVWHFCWSFGSFQVVPGNETDKEKEKRLKSIGIIHKEAQKMHQIRWDVGFVVSLLLIDLLRVIKVVKGK